MPIELLKSIYTVISKAIHPNFTSEQIDQVKAEIVKEINKLSEKGTNKSKNETKA